MIASIWGGLFWGSLLAMMGVIVLLPDRPSRGFEPLDAVIVVFGVTVAVGALA